MEGSAVESPAHQGDMGLFDADTISPLCSFGWSVSTGMERCWSIGIRDAKVLLLGPFETSYVHDTERAVRLECASTDTSFI